MKLNLFREALLVLRFTLYGGCFFAGSFYCSLLPYMSEKQVLFEENIYIVFLGAILSAMSALACRLLFFIYKELKMQHE